MKLGELKTLDIAISEKIYGQSISYDANGEPYVTGATIGGYIIGWVHH